MAQANTFTDSALSDKVNDLEKQIKMLKRGK